MKSTKIMIAVATAVVVVAVATVAWVVIGREPEQEATDAHTSAHDPLVADPGLAATSAMAALMSWQPAEQDSPQESAAAISERLTGQLESYATAGEPDPVLPDLWQAWAQAGDSVHAVATVDEGGVRVFDGEDQATVDVLVEQEVWHRSGQTTPYARFSATVGVHHVDGQWKAERYEITNIDY